MYKYVELENGFEIYPDRDYGQAVQCRLDERGTGFRYSPIGAKGNWYNQTSTLYQYYDMTNHLASQLIHDWKPRPVIKDGKEWDTTYGRDNKLREWKRNRESRVIGKFVHVQWQRLLKKCDPQIVAVQKAYFAATFKQHGVLLNPEFYTNKWLMSDIINYRAASHVVSEVRDIEEFANLDWLGYLGPDRKGYTSLNKTLMNFPGGVPAGLIHRIGPEERWNWSDVYHGRTKGKAPERYDNKPPLLRPVIDRLELIALCASYTASYRDVNIIPVMMFATREQITVAMGRLSTHLRTKLSPRKTTDIIRLVNFIRDYPELHHGNVVGLADKAIKWHIHERQAALEREEKWAAQMAETKTALPPLPLPQIPGITFLSTGADILAEGRRMQHCVGSYVSRAVKGYSFLFHVDYQGDMATIEISREGQVRQAHGPFNGENKASKWGSRRLGQWAKGGTWQSPIQIEDIDNWAERLELPVVVPQENYDDAYISF